MDQELLFKTAQNYINTPGLPLIVLGSGASMAYGIPGMWDLAQELKKIEITAAEDQDCWKEFKSTIDTLDLESTLLKVRLSENVEAEVLKRTWGFINKADQRVFKNLILKNEVFPLVELLKYFFRSSSNRTVNIITTNYDRIAEYAASVSDLYPFTYFNAGYCSSFIGEQDDCFTRAKKCTGVANICKLHGSLDWFAFEKPYPTFKSVPLQNDIPADSFPCIVTPGLSKFEKTSQTPFRELFQISDDLINKASAFFCIGYGFNDKHVHPKVLENVAKNKRPLVVITKVLTENAKKIICLPGADKILLIEDDGNGGSKIYSKDYPDGIVFANSYWELKEFLKILQ